MKVKDVMTKGAECVTPCTSLQEAASKMKTLDVGPLPVCEGDHLVGMLTDRDITVRAVAEGFGTYMGKVRDVMTPDVVYCFEDQDVQEAARLMQEHQVRRLVVLSRDQRLAGIVSLGDLAVETGGEKLAGETLERVSEPASPKTDRRLPTQPAHANPVDPVAQAFQAVGKDQPGGAQHRLQDVLPEVKDVAQKVGGFKQLAEIAETLDQPKE
jgi:CBS domain-containing protein